MEQQQPSRGTEVLAIIARLLGLVILVVGLVIGIKVIFEAWSLYEEPQRIERFAEAIDQGSNLDQLLRSFSQKKSTSDVENDSEQLATTAATQSQQPTLRISYFLAWIIALLLLMVIGGLAASAIRTGGQLALYDMQVKRYTNELLKQINNSSKKQN